MCLCQRLIIVLLISSSFAIAVVVGKSMASSGSWPLKMKSYDIWDAPQGPPGGETNANSEISHVEQVFPMAVNRTSLRDSRGNLDDDCYRY